ncbi:FAD:protein FMN transferase [Terriglobus tenax]|uniref:FAD:protein FMN transferase n=1 Tax=Terriglobus tenax TaxID=1111115 RepID=UPI0021DF744E|nr:FAD:protein FMN transferase [Terriglobus tenax]
MNLRRCMLVACGAVFFCSPLSAQQRFHATHRAMGTEFTLDLYAADEATANAAIGDAWDEVDRLDDLLSNYKPQSELSRITREARSGPVTTDPESFAFLARSVYWSHVSHGAFDITVGPLLRVWGFFRAQGRVPGEADLAKAKKDTGWQNLQLDAATRTVSFRDHRALELDPGSIGKGFAVDSVVARLKAEGISSALLSTGGSTIYALGAPPDEEGWPVTIPNPADKEHPQTLRLRDLSISTGACTEKFFVQNGHRYCHIFDPRTGRPVEGVLQSSVLSPSATDGDAVSTVAFVLPAAQVEESLRNHPEISVLVYRTANGKGSVQALRWPKVR